jgi:hypothetical protein
MDHSSIRIGALVLVCLILGGCESLDSLLDDETKAAPSEAAASVAPPFPPPEDTFCRSYADQVARPPMTPNLYPLPTQTQIRTSEFASCMSLGAPR